MQVNLRQADAIKRDISKHIGENQPQCSTRISVYSKDIAADLEAAHTEFCFTFDNNLNLHRILADIRQAVGEANHNSGVNLLLSEREKLKSQLAILSQVSGSPRSKIFGDVSVIERQVATQLKKQETDSYSCSDGTVDASVLQPEFLAMIKDQATGIKRRQKEIADALLKLNISTYVTINDRDSQFLTSLGIV